MKKIILFVLITFVSAAAFAQDLPTKEEAARVIEGYFHCIGNANAEGLRNYATEQHVIDGKLFIENFPEDKRVALKEYKVTIISIERNRDGTYHCAYTDNNVFYNGRGSLNCTLVRDGPNLLMTY